ncbi:lipopolysaccharide biosynthesis protein [Aeromicrobium sp. UC242_57]|uniref:lipopolysaccharide biosynthesis protein n=1 Tax=Aeromicrobium sp. UC242_57 TaxID=3374624 RepID=UPI0037BB65C4
MPSLRHPATRVLASSLITQAGLVVTGPLTVRLLGVEDRGEVALIVATVLLISQVGPWGLPQAFAYFIARGDAEPRALLDAYLSRYLRKTALIALLGAVGILAASRLATDLTEPLAEALLAMTGIASIMVAVLALACLTGAQRFNELAVLQAVPGLSDTAAIIVVAMIGHASIIGILVLFFVSWFAVAVIGVWLVRRGGPPASPYVPALTTLRSYARRAFVTAAAPIDNLGIDQPRWA